MWTIIKIKKNKFNFVSGELKKNFGKECIVYRPKLLLQIFKKNKLINKEINLLGDYLFCFHKKFEDKKSLNILKFVKGLKYILNGFESFQNEIIDFIDRCKRSENKKGFLTRNFFNLKVLSEYKIISGPFIGKIFKIIELNKSKIKVLVGESVMIINKKDFIFKPV